jgi:hypothetical protein
MSYYGREFHHIAKKLKGARALAQQKVSATDSVLGELAEPHGYGLKVTYTELVHRAFRPEWWATELSTHSIPAPLLKQVERREHDLDIHHDHRGEDAITLLDGNISLFFGLAVMAYEQTLISNQTPYDLAQKDPTAMSPLARRGLEVFRAKGCADCHLEPETAGATFSHLYGPHLEMEGDPQQDALNEDEARNEFAMGISLLSAWNAKPFPLSGTPMNERMEVMMLPRPNNLYPLVTKFYDNGFYDLGVSDSSYDKGIGSKPDWQNVFHTEEDLFGAGLLRRFGHSVVGRIPTPFGWDRSFSLARRHHPLDSVVSGAFKTPTLRNVALTAPYFHNGSYGTLEGVLDFYSRLGDFPDNPDLNADMRRPLPEKPGEAPELPDLAMSRADKDALLAFLTQGLTDPRVENQSAPFDHPSIEIPLFLDAKGEEHYVTIPAVGKQGGQPLETWQQRLR